jgi:hypothetical protein
MLASSDSTPCAFPYREAKRKPGIDIPVEVTGPIGDVSFKTWHKKPLVLDCSLVYSLAMASP